MLLKNNVQYMKRPMKAQNSTTCPVQLMISKPGEHEMTLKAWTEKNHQQYGCTWKKTLRTDGPTGAFEDSHELTQFNSLKW